MLKVIAIWTLCAIALGVALIQLIPSAEGRTNPPILAEPPWDSPETQTLARRACYDCHSNETSWPWYSYVAPASWIVTNDVHEGRDSLNFSEWNKSQDEAEDAAETLRDGEMPLPAYLMAHPQARLNEQERAALIAGLQRTFGED